MKIELAHDFIAKKIYQEASLEDKARASATKLLHERYRHYLSSKNLLLTEYDLIYIRPHLERMDLSREEELYVKVSKQKIKKGKRMARVKDGAIVALVCGIVFSTWGLWGWQQFSTVSKDLAEAQDTINILLRNQTQEPYHTIPIADSINTSSVPNFFKTIKLVGKITNEQNKPVAAALVQIMGAEAYTQEDGTYELYLILSPKNIGNTIPLTISKTNYLPLSQTIDTDQTEIDLALTLIRE
ncbi:hypothetical protein [Aureispira anguillae]|uniref:Uncharacterized protein n=1 Tax=Aureispira anguillae TaxID=2864201 RepID=A0A915VK32_9BACT|nr:hypothetical protein [Aureispira anguillae]BDS09446.1 hypothetical protein AsAng_0001440 [Aureispira anguillae]